MIRYIKLILLMSFLTINLFAQQEFKKKVLDNAEVEYLMSLYKQGGDHSSVGGGLGTEELTNITPTIVLTIPLNADDVLRIDASISSYTSASSSNINPFDVSGASRDRGDDDDDDDDDDNHDGAANEKPTGSPWITSTGASKSDVLTMVNVSYKHSSDNRNLIWGCNISYANEYDYSSIGFGGNVNRLLNEKNTELGLKFQVYLDQWRPIYPTELKEYSEYGPDFQSEGYFSGVDVMDQEGVLTTAYHPDDFAKVSNNARNSYSTSFFFSQILTERLQIALFSDLVMQQGLLSTPYHRMYFKDKENYYIGEAGSIPDYENSSNKAVYQLADDIERMPDIRFKVPIGMRLHYYINDYFILRSYYRYYWDDWDISAHTVQFELPIKIFAGFTLAPIYRGYTQTAAKYFAGFDQHSSTEKYYSSDYDLSAFSSNQFGLRLTYADLFSSLKFYRMGLKDLHIRYGYYSRSDGLNANIFTFSVKLIIN